MEGVTMELKDVEKALRELWKRIIKGKTEFMKKIEGLNEKR